MGQLLSDFWVAPIVPHLAADCPIVSIMPDGQISRVRFETLAFLPRTFPRIGEA
jgi:hypothetical protein